MDYELFIPWRWSPAVTDELSSLLSSPNAFDWLYSKPTDDPAPSLEEPFKPGAADSTLILALLHFGFCYMFSYWLSKS